MNCKPGDLAIVVRGPSNELLMSETDKYILAHLIGIIITVTTERQFPSVAWFFKEAPLTVSLPDGTVFKVVAFYDEMLQPIRGVPETTTTQKETELTV